MKLDRAYVDAAANQAICCWSAPDKASVELLFAKAHVTPQSIREVIEYSG
jgi:hypothetical protein